MNSAEWAAQLDDLARLEALETLHQEGLRLAQDAIAAKRAVIAGAAPSTPVLREPEPQWVSIAEAAQLCAMSKGAVAQRARRGVAAGIAQKRGGRWYVRLDRMPPERGRPTQ